MSPDRVVAALVPQLTQRLVDPHQRQPLAPRPVDANGLVAGMLELLGRTLGETVRIETALADGLWRRRDRF